MPLWAAKRDRLLRTLPQVVAPGPEVAVAPVLWAGRALAALARLPGLVELVPPEAPVEQVVRARTVAWLVLVALVALVAWLEPVALVA